ncbi:MAG: ArgE/DapE family deacylase [Terriglobales bacterium]
MPDLAQITEVLAGLVRIDSVNPELVPGGSGEGAIARHLAKFLQSAGLEARLQEVSPGRPNAIGVLKGSGGGKSLMLNGHVDTVGVAGMEAPFTPRIENGCLYGRGAQDMKGGVAAALVAVATLAREPRLRGDVIFAGVADEEYKSAGTRALLASGVRADAALVMEPTGLEVATAHKGFAWAEVETLGRAAHGSRPEEGLDAIVFMGRVLGEIERLEAKLYAGARHPLLGCGSVHASLITGGQELSSYPAQCRLSLERRLVPGEDGTTFEMELQEIVSMLSAQDPRFQARSTNGYSAQALETPRQAAIALALARAARSVMGHEAKFGTQSFWTDAALLSEAGIPSVLFGPGGAGLHSANEYVRLDDVLLCAETLAACARDFCSA